MNYGIIYMFFYVVHSILELVVARTGLNEHDDYIYTIALL